MFQAVFFHVETFQLSLLINARAPRKNKDSVHLGVRPFYKLCNFVVRRLYFQTAVRKNVKLCEKRTPENDATPE